MTKGRLWTSISGKLGIKTAKGSGSSLRRWYYGFHGIGNEGEPSMGRLKMEHMRSFKETMALISQSALDEPLEAHQQVRPHLAVRISSLENHAAAEASPWSLSSRDGQN